MKIIVLSNKDAASCLALNYIAPLLSTHSNQVYYTDRAPKQSPELTESEVSANLLSSSSLDQLSKHDRSIANASPIFDALGAKQLNSINKQSAYERLAQQQPDLIISIRHMTILQQHVIDLPTHGVINLHSGLLPAYQGVMATFWSMLNSEAQIGTTLHYIENNSIDTGAIIKLSAQPTRFDKSYLWNTLSLYKQGCDDIAKAVNDLAAGHEFPSKPQEQNGQYYSYPTQNQISQFSGQLFEASDNIKEFI